MIDSLRYRIQSAKRSLLYRLGFDQFVFSTPPEKNLVLMFHNVVPVADKQLNPRNISVGHFSFILDFLQKNFDVVPLRELNNAPKGRVAITFDDGLINNLTHAAPQLARRNMPATFFISTPRILGRDKLWPDTLSHLLTFVGDEIHLGEQTFRRSYKNHFRAVSDQTKLEDVLLKISQPEIEAFIEQLFKAIRHDPFYSGNEDFWRVMKGEEIKLVAAMPGMTIGCHGIAHVNMTKLSDDDLMYELSESRRYLSQVISANVDQLAWPFGLYDDRTAACAKEAGFTLQVGVEVIPNVRFIPEIAHRIGIYNDVDAYTHFDTMNRMIR
jgi:peptidoglycan/xylan/chitin deacetylase (PgdA/CDA1 family)